MKKLLLFLTLAPFSAFSQNVVFWTEDFGFGCNSGQYADGFFSISTGAWSVSINGPEADTPNNWFVSAEENGNLAGECGSACGNDQTLHLSADQTIVGTDLGAAYFEGIDGFCDLFGCGATNKRAESPVINCSGMGNVVMEFVYLEGGNNIDNATVWYFDGTLWSQLDDPPKTALSCSPQGIWTSYSIPLPSSSNNNTNVRIGFSWVSNDDGVATDPSFAVDDIIMTGDFATDLVPPQVICPPDITIFTEDFCASVGDYAADAIVFDDVDPFPIITQDPFTGTDLTPGFYPITITATDNSGNSNFCTFFLEVIDDDAPEMICPSNISIQIPNGQTSAAVTVPVPDVTENCGDYAVTNDFNGTDNASGTYPIGTTVVNFVATDLSGNTSDCSMTVTIIESLEDCCLADYNCDGYISVLDLIFLINEFGCTSSCFTDLDDNGIVGVSDLQIFTGLYGTICP